MTIQHAAPARNGIQVVSALPHACKTLNKAMPAPPQTGSSRMAMMNLIHFGTREEFRIRRFSKPAEHDVKNSRTWRNLRIQLET